ncbi:MAG TPA: two-component regulator propeller domain-containing protein [Chitinophagaceae bacterium]|nr:two-component regulator propeller domain-containing protein [Chitinophagaceae bacterium]
MRNVLFTALIFCAVALQAQYKTPYFNMLSVENGLPESNVNTRLQDKLGYLWLGTSNGLVRYDGYRLKQYPILNEEGIPAKPTSIRQVFEDHNGELWCIVNLQGIYQLDRKREVFVRVPFDTKDNDLIKNKAPNRLLSEKNTNVIWAVAYDSERDKQLLYSIDLTNKKTQVYNDLQKGDYFIPGSNSIDLSIDPAGKIWMLTDSLLSYFEPVTKSFKPFFVIPQISGVKNFISVKADPVDANFVWINTNNAVAGQLAAKDTRGLIQLNTRTKNYIISIPGSKTPGAIPLNCFHTFTDSLKRLWVSTEKGISLYDPKKGSFIQYALNYPNKETHAENITAEKDGNLWITGNVGGLFFLDIKTGISYNYEPNGGPGDLPGNRNLGEIFIDRFNTLWINIPNEGIAWRDVQKTQFSPVGLNPFPKTGTAKETPHQYDIIGTEGDSICYLTDSTKLLAWNTIKNNFNSIDLKDKKYYRSIINISKVKDGSFWLACGGNGLVHYEPVSGKVTQYLNDPQDSTSLASPFVIDVAGDQGGTIWIATVNKGINSYNPQTKKFTRYPFATNNGSRQVKDSLDDQTATCLYIDKDGIIWIGTNNGAVNSFDPRTQKFRSYLNYKEGFFSITSIYEDSRKRLWATTYLSGLYLLDKKTGAIQRFSEKEGLIHNSVFSVKEDAAGNIWAATQKGMSRINPVTNTITNFGAAKPWMWEYFMKNLYDRNGFFNLAGRNGIIRFNPLQLGENKTPPAVFIESVSYRPSGQENDSLLFTEGRQKIQLKYNENRVTFQFTALHFANPEQNQYAFQLEGYDRDWIQAGNQHTVTYSNLSPGTYTFRVKASNSEGVWNETGAVFTITITPPWWKTWWAYVIYGLLFLGSVFALDRYLRHRLVQKEREKNQARELAQAKEIEKAYNELKTTQQQLIQSEKMASLGELTAGIAHEIQNPLNFVNNFSEVNTELIEEMKEELKAGKTDDAMSLADDIKANNEKIAYHGKRADSIVKGMLQHSRSSSGQKELTDLNNLVDECMRLSFHGMRAKDKSFNAKMDTSLDESLPKINIVSQEIGRVLLNLFTNSFYSVMQKKKNVLPGTAGEEYSPLVSATTKNEGNKAIIVVRDNGNGIPQKVIDKIFQPFFTTKPAGEGTGLGLSMSYEIITKGHEGELKVDTREGEFAEFTIILPI